MMSTTIKILITFGVFFFPSQRIKGQKSNAINIEKTSGINIKDNSLRM